MDYYTNGAVTEPILNVSPGVRCVLYCLAIGDVAGLLLVHKDDPELFQTLVDAGLAYMKNGEPGFYEEVETAGTCMRIEVHEEKTFILFDESVQCGNYDILQWLLRQLPAEVTHLEVECSSSASRATTDSFGGHCVFITRDRIRTWGTQGQLDRWRQTLDPKTPRASKILEENGVVDVADLVEDLCAFIDKHGLVQDLREFLRGDEEEEESCMGPVLDDGYDSDME